ncbi:transmembrane protein, putative [Medicago truncatula]|uniref:Transmembrane protein, putative n=1 Tax=Medicago truncatula TaxID=3880 RepID=A0A072U6N2_MEDTR|nr:transmembrane protein, putative [Medicago truncatula]
MDLIRKVVQRSATALRSMMEVDGGDVASAGGGVVVCATGCGVHRDCSWAFCCGFSFHVVTTSNSSVINPPSSGFLPDRRKVLHGGFMFVLPGVFCSSVAICLLPEVAVLGLGGFRLVILLQWLFQKPEKGAVRIEGEKNTRRIVLAISSFSPTEITDQKQIEFSF